MGCGGQGLEFKSPGGNFTHIYIQIRLKQKFYLCLKKQKNKNKNNDDTELKELQQWCSHSETLGAKLQTQRGKGEKVQRERRRKKQKFWKNNSLAFHYTDIQYIQIQESITTQSEIPKIMGLIRKGCREIRN